MIVLHANWVDAALYLWGERCDPQATPGRVQAVGASPRGESGGWIDGDRAAPLFPLAVPESVLRRVLGDVYDSLLVSGGVSSTLSLRLPFHDGRPIPSYTSSCSALKRDGGNPPAKVEPPDSVAPVLVPCRVPSLVFSASDAVDLLATSPSSGRDDLRCGASLRYWSKAAMLVLELLAKQRFVPAIHRAGGHCYRGYWRVVVDDRKTSARLRELIVSMPPVCRSLAGTGEVVQAAALVENFLWTTVDALVRRCMEGDELAHAINEHTDSTRQPQTRWLRSLVGRRSEIAGTLQERSDIFETVHRWLKRLEPPAEERTYRLCFRLRPPRDTDGACPEDSQLPWELTPYVQSVQDPGMVLDASSVMEDREYTPKVLKRPFSEARARLHSDIAEAARYFPPVERCLTSSGVRGCNLTLQESYEFLRNAAPMLEAEGFIVWAPKWWGEDRPRLRMWLDIRPPPDKAETGSAAMTLDTIVSFDWKVAIGDEELSREEIARLAASKEQLLKVRGRWTEVQPSDVKAAVRFLKQSRGGRMTLFEALRQCYIADDLGTGLPVAGLRAHGWIEEFLNSGGNHQAIKHLPAPPGFRGTLRPYQLRGLEWLSFLTRLGLGACLADDMGLGKTIQLIALLLHERSLGCSLGPTLLVVPMSLVGNWRREIERFAPSLRVMVHHGLERLTGQAFVDRVPAYDAVISTYGLIHRDLGYLAAVNWYRIVLDEAQNIKNPAAKQAEAIRSLPAVHRVALTGTPVENRLSELWSIMEFLNPGYLGAAAEFRRRFAIPIERYRDTDRARRLRHLIRPFVLRRLKSDPKVQVDLPEKMEMKVFCNLTREQAALYEAVVSDMLRRVDRAGGIQRRGLILATLVRLKQVCNHPAHFLGDGSSIPHRSGKCDRLTEMIEEVLAEGDRALVFTQYREMGDLLQPFLRDTFGCEVLFLHGGTSRKNRDAIVARFQDEASDAPLLILSLKAGGFGLNLTAASHVFHFDRWWNPAVEEQATARSYRIGQSRCVQVHKFVCIGTLEEKIDLLLEEKRNLADNIVGAGEEWLTELSTEQLREVITLSRDAVAEG